MLTTTAYEPLQIIWRGYKHARLTFGLFLGHSLPNFIRYEIVPFQLATGTLVHGRLERPELSNGLQLFDCLYRFFEEIRVRVAFGGLLANGLERRRVLLQVLRRPAEEVLQI